jgi:hypothetical protein
MRRLRHSGVGNAGDRAAELVHQGASDRAAAELVHQGASDRATAGLSRAPGPAIVRWSIRAASGCGSRDATLPPWRSSAFRRGSGGAGGTRDALTMAHRTQGR